MTTNTQHRRGLGRGLGSLIPTAPRAEEKPVAEAPTGSSVVEDRENTATGHGSTWN